MSRSYRGPMLVATQGIESLFAIYPGQKGEAKVETLVAGLGSKCICLPTWKTAQWTSGICGQKKQFLRGANSGPAGYSSPMDLIAPGPSQASGSASQQWLPIIRPEELLAMRSGGPQHDWIVDALLIQSGRRFDTGYHFTPVEFRQEV